VVQDWNISTLGGDVDTFKIGGDAFFCATGKYEVRQPWPNNSRGCVKSAGVKFGHDQFLDMGNFDEMSWRIQWSEI